MNRLVILFAFTGCSSSLDAPVAVLEPSHTHAESLRGCYSFSWSGDAVGVWDAGLLSDLQLTADRVNAASGDDAAFRGVASYALVDGRIVSDDRIFASEPTWRIVLEDSLEVDITGSAWTRGRWILGARVLPDGMSGSLLNSRMFGTGRGASTALVFTAERRGCT